MAVAKIKMDNGLVRTIVFPAVEVTALDLVWFPTLKLFKLFLELSESLLTYHFQSSCIPGGVSGPRGVSFSRDTDNVIPSLWARPV